MASTFDTMMADKGRPALLSQFGTLWRYHAIDGSGETVTLDMVVSMGPVEERPEQGDHGVTYKKLRSAVFSTNPSAPEKGIANPRLGDYLDQAGGQPWYIRAIEAMSGAMCRVTLVRTEAHEVGKVRYKGA